MKIDRGRIVINETRCKGCGLCIDVCPNNNISLNTIQTSLGNKIIAIYNESNGCNACQLCACMCPDIAIDVYR